MMARRCFGRGVLGVLIGSAVSGLGGCGLLGRNSYRFRMIVEVQTPQGLKRGSSVFEVFAAAVTKILPEEGPRVIEVKGQAVIVDLPNGPLFALTRPADSQLSGFAEMSMRVLDPDFHSMMDSVDSAARIGGWSDRRGEVPREHWPLMVRFRDIDDPTSVERVDPVAIGVKRIVVETTSDKLTTGIDKRLPWLARLRGGYLHGGFTSRGAPLGLDGTAFSTEIGK